MIFRFRNIALAALCCALTTGLSAWADTTKPNPVTGETETYANVFIGGTEWNDAANWDTSTTPFISGNYDPALVDGNKVSTSTAIDGYQLRVGAYNDAAVTWSGGITKIQAGSTGCWLTADETSSITIASFAGNQLEGSSSTPFKLSSAKAGGITWSSGLTSASNTSLPFWYYLKGKGTVVYDGDITVANAQVIKQADITLSGTSQVASKTLVTFGSGTTATFAADATIKRLNSSGVDLESDAHLSIVNYSGEKSLKTSDGVGKCELVQTSTGIILYWVDGDPTALAPETYKPSISVNFTSGTSLSTSADVGIGDYAIPGTSWNNLIGNNGSLSTLTSVDTNGTASALYGASVTISGTRGYWTRDGLDAASELRQGYIDDNDGNPTPTVTVTGIPYGKYKVVIICSSDKNTTKFGYMTVNGTHYKGGSGTTETCSGTDSDIWGSASDSTWIEGDNFLVTPEIANTDGKLTIVSHRLTGSRAGLAAIQVVEVAPTKTENDLVINVSGDTDYSVDETKALSGTVYVTGNGTLTLSGSSKITAASIDVGPLVTINANADRLDATAYTGLGTVVYSNALPPSDKGWTDSAWTGTVWIKSHAIVALDTNLYGNKGSTLKFTGVTGYFAQNHVNTVPIELENNGSTAAFNYNNGWGGELLTFSELKGTGTLQTSNAGDGGTIWVKKWDAFTGVMNLGKKQVVMGGSEPAHGNVNRGGKLVIAEGAVVTNLNATTSWTAGGGIEVNGTFAASDRTAWTDGTAMIVNSTGILNMYGSGVNDTGKSFANVTGTGTIWYSQTTTANDKWSALPSSAANMFANTLSVSNDNVNAGVIITMNGASDVVTTNANISGTGYFRSDWGTGANRGFLALQSKSTTWSGTFGSSSRIKKFIVAGVDGATDRTLTLAGTQSSTIPLTVESLGSVNLTGTWVGDATVSGTFGGTGTLNGALTFAEGSTLNVFASDKDGLAVSGTLTCPATGTVKVDVSGIDLEGVYYLPILSGLTSADPKKFELVDSSIPFGFVFAGGELGLERKSDYLELYNDYVTLTLNNIGTTPITNYTLLVRISTAQLPGFSYERAGDGSKIAFSDGHGAPLVHEIDTWNTHGESLVWVKVPEAVNGTQVKFYWSLKDGKKNPENEPGDVWSDYAGVWHMNDGDTLDATGANTTAQDESAEVRDDGVVGGALGKNSIESTPFLTITQTDAMKELATNTYTVSFWSYFNTRDVAGGPVLFASKNEHGTEGWGGRVITWGNVDAPSGNNLRIYYGSGSQSNMRVEGLTTGVWLRNDVVFSPGSIGWYVNGVGKTASYSGENKSGSDYIYLGALPESANTGFNGAIDEFRIRAGGVEAARIVAEMANADFTDYYGALEGDGVSFLVPGMVVRDGGSHDYWVKDPTISHSYWTITSVPDVKYTPGILRSGSSVTNWCENLLTHEEYDVSSDTLRSLPGGTYCIHCKTEGAFEIDEDERKVYFTIVKDSGTASAGDTAGGRILLMNNDFSQGGTADEPTIGSQGYSDTNETASVYCYWAFPDGFDDIVSTINPKPGKSSILWSVDGDTTNKLWHLVSSRHGNTFPSDGSALVPGQNYLPWSTKSCSITNGNVAAQSGADAGQILMLNTTDAMVYSPCYDEGIGTIYFDAVNGYTNNPAAYQLLVEYATVTTNHTPVVDANLWQYDDDGNVTNYYGNLDETCWQACEVKVARVTGGDTIDYSSTFTGPFTLAVVSDSPTTGEFYRVYAKLDMREPVRFRIRRANFDSDRGLDEAYLLLDNIIVSYPAMSATLSPAGQYDDTKKGSNVLGFESAFSSAFPYAGEKLFAKAKVDYYINSATNLTETNFLASAKMYYRWRYLNQPSPKGWEWKCVELFNEGDFFRSSEELDLPEIPGDVEFWYEYIPQAPYYRYVDYTGLPELQNAFAKEYTEATLGPQTNRSTKVDSSYPTMGNDWFVRLREGASSNEVWRIYLRNVDGSPYNADGNGLDYVDFAITESGSWRGFVRTPEVIEDGLEYRIEQINPRADDLALTYSTNFWNGAATFTSTVKSITLVPAADGDEWTPVPCPATTSFLMFVLDEDTPTLSVTSADLQNFNTWNYANKNEIMFVGTSTDDGQKNGVSPGMNTYGGEFDKWVPCSAEHPDGYWEEHFNETLDTGRFTGYTLIPQTTTPNGWSVKDGMWIYQKYKDPTPSDSMALQLRGGGSGSLSLLDVGDVPRGIESISLRARIAQSATLDNFAYKQGGYEEGYTNYCFVVQAAMSTNAVTATDSWDSGFDGLGQLSLLAAYRPGEGGYEFRIIRWKERRYRAELCKWVGNECQVVNACEADFTVYSQMPYTKVNDGVDMFPTLLISVEYQDDGSCKVQGGFSYGEDKNGGHSAEGVLPTKGKYLTLSYWDATPPTEWGTYGIASANCDAIFTGAKICDSAAGNFDTKVTKGKTYTKSDERFQKVDCATYNSSYLGTYKSETIDKKRWYIPSRFTTNTASQVVAVADAQPLLIQWRRPTETNDDDWKTVVTTNISSFTLSELMEVPLLITEDAQIRLQHGGGSGNVVDIAVDDVAVRQWRGDDYNGKYQTYFKDYGSPTNFVFTSAWLNEEGSVELTAARAMTNKVSSLRSPLMDGEDGRGLGLGMFSFSYTNADSRAVLSLQVATPDLLNLSDYTEALSDDSRWTTVTNFVFAGLSEEKLAGGVMSHYLGMYGEKGVMRLVVDKQSVVDAQASRDPTYGRIFITDVICRDEPKLNTSSWWGWNIRTSQDLYSNDDKLLANLADWPGSVGADAGMSLALNNSAEDDIDILEGVTYRQHQPFLQTPVFTNKTAVGEISFKARRYDYPSDLTARVCIYGAHNGTEPDEEWKYVTHFDITNDYYSTYTFKEKGTLGFEVLRLVVVGVDLVESHHGNLDDPGYGAMPVVRVALDDVLVTEALMPKLAFKNVFAFRGDGSTDLLNTKYVNRFGDKAVQPLAGEAWGVQAEIYAEQLPDEIDFDRGVTVTLYWFDGGINPWGYDNWKNRSSGEVHSAKLVECDDVSLAFRSSYAGEDGSSVVGQASEYSSGSIVQYMLKAEYYLKGDSAVRSVEMGSSEWVKPEWYNGVDYNSKYDGFSAYTILDSVAPGWAWINEVNIFGGFDDDYNNIDKAMQYVEVAMPIEADLTGWHLDFLTRDNNNNILTNTAYTFSADQTTGRTKTKNGDSNCVFYVISGPESKQNLEALKVNVKGVEKDVEIDGTWQIESDKRSNFLYEDEGLDAMLKPIGMLLVRSSDIVEHSIVLEGTNYYYKIPNRSASAFAEHLSTVSPGIEWVAVGDDSIAGNHSLGVTNLPANVVANWNNMMVRTPGFINDNQKIDPIHPVANSSSYIVYATFADDSAGHMTQTLGHHVGTTSLAMAVVPKGTATNITYNVENWYELASVTVDGVEQSLANRKGSIEVPLGGPATSNNISVVASSRIATTLSEDWGLTPDNRYTSAVVDWLNKGSTLRGAFANPAGSIAAAQFVPLSRNPDAFRDLTLTEMYWLDIDPTDIDSITGSNNWWFVGGIIKPPTPNVIVKPSYQDGLDESNLTMGMYMCITNTATSDYFAPYVLRGVEVGSVSTNYSISGTTQWEGPTFKILGRLFNTDSGGNPDEFAAWLPLRSFVLNENSFRPKGESDEFQSVIEVFDPYSTDSVGGANAGWGKFKGKSTVFFSWSIDDEDCLVSTNPLCPTNSVSK